MTILFNALQHLWNGQRMSGDEVIALVLLGAMLVSSGHLLTMLATRWGDRHIAFKSLIGSVMVHIVCLATLQVFDPLEAVAVSKTSATIPPLDVITEIFVESDDEFYADESGNTAMIPDKPVEPDVQLFRTPQDSRSMEETPVERDEIEVLDSVDTTVDDIAQFAASDRPEMAQRVDAGFEGIQSAAAMDLETEADSLLEKSTVDQFVPELERVVTERGDILDSERPRERMKSEGSVNDIAPEVTLEDKSLISLADDEPDELNIPIADVDDSLQWRSAPVNSTDPLKNAGISLDQPTQDTKRARSFESRIPRRSRSIRMAENGADAVRESSVDARSPIPLQANREEVRIGVTSLNDTDALRSVAEVVDADRSSIRRRESRPASYRLRSVEERRDAAAKFGGTVESEAAVELSLRWLSEMQSPDGHWDAAKFGGGQVKFDDQNVDRDYAGRDADSGLTALVTLAFLGAGYTHEEGKYAVIVDNALDWLISRQESNGDLSADARHFAKMYCHAMATYALAEATGMQQGIVAGPLIPPEELMVGPAVTQIVASSVAQNFGVLPHLPIMMSNGMSSQWVDKIAYSLRKVDDIRLRSALARAVSFTIRTQNPVSGGWRYRPGQDGDVSMFGWHMMSLKSADIAGIKLNPTVRERMIGFLNRARQGKSGGLFGYRIPDGQQEEPVTPVMTAEALFCQQMLGYPRESAASKEAVNYLLGNRPRLSRLDLYYWYYGTLAMYQFGGREWEQWNSSVRDLLISEQRTDGQFAGSWDPKGPWGSYGGRVYSTAIATLTLEVYYRLLPLYRLNDQ